LFISAYNIWQLNGRKNSYLSTTASGLPICFRTTNREIKLSKQAQIYTSALALGPQILGVQRAVEYFIKNRNFLH